MASGTSAAPEGAIHRELQLAEAQKFIEHEADLLDEQSFDEWLELFADDGYYWVPARAGQESPLTHVSLFYDDKPTLKIRVERLKHPQIHSQTPRSKTVRLVSNFRLLPSEDGSPDERCVTSKFVMLEDRSGVERRLFGGRYTYRLRAVSGGLRIVWKRVDLTDCDQFFSSLTQPF